MRTVSYKSVLYGAAQKLGLDPNQNLQENQAIALTEYLNVRLQEAVESYDFPDFSRTERRAFRDTYDSAETYQSGQEVWSPSEETYYASLQDDNTNHPVTDGAWWGEVEELERYFELDQANQTPIGDVFNVFTRDPRNPSRASLPGPLNFLVTWRGVEVETTLNQVWVVFRTLAPTFTTLTWFPARTYGRNEQVYDPASGENYRSLQASNTGHAVSDTAWWEVVQLPRFLSSYLKQAIYADALREDGQNDKALEEEARAEQLLVREYDKLNFQQNQRQTYSVRVG